jgi:hypothetical protein
MDKRERLFHSKAIRAAVAFVAVFATYLQSQLMIIEAIGQGKAPTAAVATMFAGILGSIGWWELTRQEGEPGLWAGIKTAWVILLPPPGEDE